MCPFPDVLHFMLKSDAVTLSILYSPLADESALNVVVGTTENAIWYVIVFELLVLYGVVPHCNYCPIAIYVVSVGLHP